MKTKRTSFERHIDLMEVLEGQAVDILDALGIHEATVSYQVESYFPGRAAVLYAAAEDCYPEESAEVEFYAVDLDIAWHVVERQIIEAKGKLFQEGDMRAWRQLSNDWKDARRDAKAAFFKEALDWSTTKAGIETALVACGGNDE